MGRNWMDAVCKNCPKVGGDDFPFRVLTGNPLICPECGRVVNLEEVFHEERACLLRKTTIISLL